MFRRKDADQTRHGTASDAEVLYPRPIEPRATDGKGQPELPRRHVEMPPTLPVPVERAMPTSGAAPTPTPAEAKQLIVGRGISLSGEITACDRLIVQGSVQVTLNQTRAIEIADGGRFTHGRAEVEEAEISGLYEGELTVTRRLLIRSTGEVRGTVRYGELQIEQGGRLSGSVTMLDDSQPVQPVRPTPID